MKTYIYKLDKRYKKRPEILLKYGFACYKSEDDGDVVFAYPVHLSENHPLFTQCKRFFEHIYETATTEEREADFKDFEFKRILRDDQTWGYELVMDEDLTKQFSECQLCCGIFGMDKNALFINSPMQNTHYNYETVHEAAPDLIEQLLKDRIIFAKKIKV